MNEPTLESLIEALRRLPGVGVKSAQRMAFQLLQHDRDGAPRIAAALQDAVTRLARGVPAGSELEYVDLSTIAHALVERR